MKIVFPVKNKRKRGTHVKKRYHAFHHLREWLWPSMGWVSLARWLELKLKRTDGSAHKVALGFACGIFISFTPFMGLHITLGALIAWLLKSNVLVSVLGTVIGNPWTFPFIWAWSYKLGNFILSTENPESFSGVINILASVHSFESLWQNLGTYWNKILFPMAVGGIPTGVLVGLGFYLAIRFNIESWRKARTAHMLLKRKAYRKKVTNIVISKLKNIGDK